MPGLLPLSEGERETWLRSYEYSYLERDLGDLARQHGCEVSAALLGGYRPVAPDVGDEGPRFRFDLRTLCGGGAIGMEIKSRQGCD